MKRISYLVVALVGLIFLGSVPARADDPNGVDLYAKKCLFCHGKDAKGKPGKPELDLTKEATTSKTDQELAGLVKNGVNRMPAYKDKLSDAEIKSIVDYLRTLK